MRFLVTGATGYLGSHFVPLARAQGHEVVAAGHARTADLQLDVRDSAAVERAVRDMAPEVIIHMAYVQDGPDAWPVNVDGAANVARAAGTARLVHLSSDVVFDGRKAVPYVEDDPPTPVTDYGRSKAEAESRVRAAAPAALLVRTSLIYGGRTPSNHEQLALRAAEATTETSFFTDELRCPVQVDDLAAALLELAAADVAGPLHVAGADTVSRHTFARLVVAAHGLDPERLAATTTTALALVRPLACALDCARARRLLHTELRGVRTVLGP